MQIEEAKGDLKYYIEEDLYFNGTYEPVTDFEKYCYNHCKAIETVLNELEKAEKAIEKMAKHIAGLDIDEDICKNCNLPYNKISCYYEGYEPYECVKEYFYNKED